MTSEGKAPPDVGIDPAGEGTPETITLFAPFEAQKPSRSLFQRSPELESKSSSNKDREIEFQTSEAQASGNAKVLFRKLKAAASWSSLSPSIQFEGSSNQYSGGGRVGVEQHTYDGDGSLRSHRSKVSPTPSSGSVASFVGSGGEHRQKMDHSMNETPEISLTSYSDARSRAIGKQLPSVGGVARLQTQPGGVARPQTQPGGVPRPQTPAVNKTEMLKRFGSIADNQVQVRREGEEGRRPEKRKRGGG
jgi:hypothetical protein